MLPMKAVRQKLATLLAADASTLAPATDANKVALIVAPFSPSENLVIGDLTLASFAGGDPIAGTAGTQGTGNIPGTGQQRITMVEPAGGWHWKCTADPATPQTITGLALINNAGDTLLGVQAINPTVTISFSGDEYDAGSIDMTFVPQPIS